MQLLTDGKKRDIFFSVVATGKLRRVPVKKPSFTFPVISPNENHGSFKKKEELTGKRRSEVRRGTRRIMT